MKYKHFLKIDRENLTAEALQSVDRILELGVFSETRALTASELVEAERLLDVLEGSNFSPEKDLQWHKSLNNGGQNNRGSKKPYEIRQAHDPKDFRSLYGSSGGEYRWTDEESSFFGALFSGRYHPGLTKRAMSEGSPSDGGFLVPVEQSEIIHNVSLENELVMPRCLVQPMSSNELKLPGVDIGNHGTNLFGGFTASYKTEAGTLSEANPKVRQMSLNAKKLTGFLRFSSELAQDMVGGERKLRDICGKGLAWYRDKAFLKGTGAGEPLGIMNSDAMISIAKESGQAADTVVYVNLCKMFATLN